MLSFRLAVAVLAALAILPLPAAAAALLRCQFILGFNTLHDALPQVGACTDDQAFAANGDALQHTAGGLLAWRKADNWTAFTDGYRTWVNGPHGIQQRLNSERFPWEGDSVFGGWTLDGLTVEGAAKLAPGSSSGTLTSPPRTPAAPFQQLVASWNASTPAGTWIEVKARALQGQAWTHWYSLGVWASEPATIKRHSLDGQSDGQGSVATDTFKPARPASAYQLSVTLSSNAPGLSPTLEAVSAVTNKQDSAGDRAAWGVDLPVPARSQMLPAYRGLGFGGGGEVWCSPTSTSMIMAYWASVLHQPGLDQSVPAAAAGTYDYTYQGTGNWPFNVAYAASFGLSGSVARMSSFAAIEPWIAARVPVAISIAFDRGQLDGAPIDSTAGHLLVVRGFTSNGDVIVNDPAVTANGVSSTYKRGQLERAWQGGSGGAAYLIYPRGWSVPS